MAKRIILLFIVLFVSLNIFLINKDDDKIKRISYIPKWTEVTEKDMYETFDTTGIIDYSDKQFVYFNESEGVFNEFLVEKGDNIYKGDELFSYEIKNYDDIKTQLDIEITRLESDIRSIEESIRNIERSNVQSPNFRISLPDIDEAIEIKQNNSNIQLQIEQYIIEKEQTLEQTKAQLEAVEAQYDELIANGKVVYIESPAKGKVTEISTSLTNPVITIESDDLHIVGHLTENERMSVEEEMPVEINLIEESNSESFDGEIDFVSDEPEDVLLNKTSTYPFHVSFNDDNELDELLRGYHVNLNVTVDESINASVTNKSLIPSDSYIWRMDHSGVVRKEQVETGIEMGNYIELMNGIYPGERIAIDSRSNLIDGATFITPLSPNKSDWKTMFKDGSRKRSIFIGLLAR